MSSVDPAVVERPVAVEGADPSGASSPDPVRSFGYLPALDGVRAIAVVVVMLYHHNGGRVPGGWLGVSLFFTLSGFLIARVVLDEVASTGRVHLGGFWARRLRRLLPASLLALGLALAVAWYETGGIDRSTADDVRAALLYVANWRFVFQDASYADAAAFPSPVQHYWSLAIEEQFYLVFPLLMAWAALRRRAVAVVLGAVVLIGLALQLTITDVDRVYFGTDTRAPEIAVGVALAYAWPRLRAERDRLGHIPDVLGFVAFAALGALVMGAHLDERFVGSGGLTAVTVVWVGVLISATLGRAVPSLLSVSPLPALGRISYGVYLYHWPIFLLLRPDRVGVDGPALFVVRSAVTVALAAVSARLIERPIREQRTPALSTPRVGLVAAVGAIVVVGLVATVAPRFDTEEELVAAGVFLDAPTVTSTTPTTPGRPEETTGAPDEPSTDGEVETGPTSTRPAAVSGGDSAGAPDAPGVPSTPTTVPKPAAIPRLLVIGDSTADAQGAGLRDAGQADGIAAVAVRSLPGCTVLPYLVAHVRPGYTYRPKCSDLATEAARLVAADAVDAIVVFVGSAQLLDAEFADRTGIHSILETAIQSAYRTALQSSLARFGSIGVPVLWADLPQPDWDLDAFGELVGGPAPGVGEASSNDPARGAMLNRLDTEGMSGHANVARWPYAAAVASVDAPPEQVRTDGLHIDREVGTQLARDQLFDLLESAYRQVRLRSDAQLVPDRDTTWDRAPVG